MGEVLTFDVKNHRATLVGQEIGNDETNPLPCASRGDNHAMRKFASDDMLTLGVSWCSSLCKNPTSARIAVKMVLNEILGGHPSCGAE